MKKSHNRWTWMLLAVLLLTACNLPSTATPVDPMLGVRTAAALTVEAMFTQAVPTQSLTAQPTQTPPAPTPASPTSDPNLPCNLAEFVSESVPDGSQFFPGSVFVKTWTLRNAGSCVWTIDYQLEYVSGNIPDILSLQKLTNSAIAPGQNLTLMLNIAVPFEPGNYRADFRLRDGQGSMFSFKNPEKTFWVAVEVINTSLNLAENLCAADWTSGAGKLNCPGKAGSADGFAYVDASPLLENGSEDDEPAIWLSPQEVQNGYIQGAFPAQRIPEKARFEAVLGCAKSALACDADFSLYVQAGVEVPRLLAAWNETNDGAFRRISYDLTNLAGQNLRLILRVDSRGSAVDDILHLLMPVLRSYQPADE
ncbi:MAG TPA: NBR1-Ig-like domain-containing protein [Anaerolineaceae bacterium]|nr:NBR1-Ig-like domain-containing protein [Anaerolineaceae bacterium]